VLIDTRKAQEISRKMNNSSVRQISLTTWCHSCVISGFRHEVDENCALLGYYAASSGNFLPMFRDNLSVPFSGVKIFFFWILDQLKIGPIVCTETSARN
jgi:hypothetical protein